MKGTVLLSAIVAATLAVVIGRMPPAARPQLVSGEDVLSVAFGDAKATICRAMVQKADSYFHGGVDMECSCHHDHHDGERHEGHHEAHAHEHPESPSSNASCSMPRVSCIPDPWRWINSHIRAPEVERHLEGARAVELIPWLWAAVKASPHDTDVWTTAWYIAAYQMKDDSLALHIAKEGLIKNPSSLEVACVLGRSYRAKGTCDHGRAEKTFRDARNLALEKSGGDPSRLNEHDQASFLEILHYLSMFETERRSSSALKKLLDEAKSVNPRHALTLDIERRLSKVVDKVR